MDSLSSRTKLNSGVPIPLIGFGVYETKPGAETHSATLAALQHGYRLIDTARVYRNERDVGAAVRASGIPRNEIVVTTKLWNSDQGYEATLRACDRSIEALGIGEIDIYLIHWPVSELRRETWRAMLRLLEEKKVRAIGVSNYTIRHLEELLAESPIVPALNQVELSPFLHQEELLAFCKAKNILLEAYSPLTRGRRLGQPVLADLGQKYGKTAAQVLLRWVVQHDAIPIPKSARPERIVENANIFDFALSHEDMERLDALDEGFRAAWDPSNVP